MVEYLRVGMRDLALKWLNLHKRKGNSCYLDYVYVRNQIRIG